MSARIVSLEDEGPTASLLIELTLQPRVTIPEAAVQGFLMTPEGAIEAPGLERRPLAVLKGVERRFLYRLDLAQGEDHHLLFTLRPSDPSFTGPAPSAYIPVSLDPSRRPERHGAYLQHRAKAERP